LSSAETSLAQKVQFLLRNDSYSGRPDDVRAVETHMSWVFLAGDKAYKLKKPLKLAYLDFSTLAKREAACRAEIALNRRLAGQIYRDVVPLCRTPQGLRLGDGGPAIEWLVVMRRLDLSLMLDAQIAMHSVDRDRIRALEGALTDFYHRARPIFTTPAKYLAKWHRLVNANRLVLLNPKLNMPQGSVLRADHAQQRFLARFGTMLVRRLQRQKIVDAHGDLRPEHIWLGTPLSIIDCLEFNSEFRAVDPFDEISYLAIECERLGDAEAGRRIVRKLSRTLLDSMPPELLAFYRCYRATLRANLSISHLLEETPRTPEKWRPLALRYLHVARREAEKLEQMFNRRAGRRAAGLHAADGSLRRTGSTRRGCRSSPGAVCQRRGTAAPYR